MQSYLPDDYTFLSYIQKPGLAEDFFTLQCGRTGLRAVLGGGFPGCALGGAGREDLVWRERTDAWLERAGPVCTGLCAGVRAGAAADQPAYRRDTAQPAGPGAGCRGRGLGCRLWRVARRGATVAADGGRVVHAPAPGQLVDAVAGSWLVDGVAAAGVAVAAERNTGLAAAGS